MPTAPTPIDAGPAVPNANDPEVTFDAMFEASLTWQKDDLQPQANALAENVYDNAVEAAASAVAADASADAAALSEAAAVAAAASAINAPGTQATSTTSLSLSTGTKVFTLAQTGKLFPVGGRAYAASASDPSGRRMVGTVMANNPGTGAFTLDVLSAGDVAGSGTYADWIISNAGEGSALPAATVPDAGKVLGVTSGGVYGLLASRGVGGAAIGGNQTLTNTSPGVQRITPTGPGQWIQMADATTLTTGTGLHDLANLGGWDVEIRDATGVALGYILPGTSVVAHLASNATAAGSWDMQEASVFGTVVAELDLPLSLGSGTTGVLAGAVSIDANRELLLLAGDARLYGVVWDAASSTFGTPVLIRAAGVATRARAINTVTDQALVISCNSGTGLEAVALTITGTAITVNTAATATLAGNVISIDEIIPVVGQGWVLAYRRATTQGAIRALTVTGTTVAIGAESLTTGDTNSPPMPYDIGSGKVVVVDVSSTTTTVGMRTMSGTTLTAGTAATLTNSFASHATRMLGSGRVAVVYRGAAGVFTGAIVSVTGTVVSTSTVTLSALGNNSPTVVHQVGSQVIVGSGNGSSGCRINVLTDSAGTAVAGTELIRDRGGVIDPVFVAADSTSVTMLAAAAATAATGEVIRVGVSGNNAVVLAARALTAGNYANGGASAPSTVAYNKEALPAGVLRGSAACVAGLADTRNLLWVSRAGMPVLVPAQPLQWLAGGQGRLRSAEHSWEWTGQLVQTGLTVALQKLKVA